MMRDTKKEFKFFTITQYKQEEEYLSSMHRNGWKFLKVVMPGFYYFEKCEPENVTYRLDYNQEGITHKAEYIQLFSDCGWEYLLDFVGYSYFRKASEVAAADEEIFCDDESRLDMMKRVYKGRIIPLIALFLCVIVPQFMMNVVGYGGGGLTQDLLSVFFLAIGILYLSIFCMFTVQFYQYEKHIHPEDENMKWKYAVIYLVLIIFALAFCGGVILKFV